MAEPFSFCVMLREEQKKRRRKEGRRRRLVDSDAADLVLLSLGDDNAQDTILEAGRDVLVLDAGGEVEGAGELADAALGEPVLGVVDGLLLLLLLGNFVVGLVVVAVGALVGDVLPAGLAGLGLLLILDGGLLRGAPGRLGRRLLALGDGAAHSGVLEGGGGGVADVVGSLGPSPDDHGLGLGELDADILLAHARQLAMELVGVSRLADVELGSPGGDRGAAGALVRLALAGVVVKVVEETEERGEGGVGGSAAVGKDGVVEESHCSGLVVVVVVVVVGVDVIDGGCRLDVANWCS